MVTETPTDAPHPQAGEKLTPMQGVELFLLVSVVFLLYNRQAYSSYFFDDAFDHLTWTTVLPLSQYFEGLVTWKFSPVNFRPVAHYFYRFLYDVAGYDFPAWIAALHILHLTAVWLLWLNLRRLGASLFAAATGTAVFALNMTAFYVYWRPMFHFDLLCGLFLLLALYLYQRNQLVLSLLAFWLAYKSKEIGVVFPAILLAYEWWFGGRRWWRLAPFAAISASFTLQAFLHNRQTDTPYTLRVTPAAVGTCVRFYADHALFFPLSGLLLPLLYLLRRDKRVLFGLWFALCTLAPMFLLPSRLYDAYLYVPSAGLAIAFVFVLEKRPVWVPITFCAVWLAANLVVLRMKAPHELELAGHNERFFTAACTMAARHPEIRGVIFRNSPPEMGWWGLAGVYRLAVKNPAIPIYWAEAPEAASLEKEDRVAIAEWDYEADRLSYRITHHHNAIRATVSFATADDLALLGPGWYGREGQGFCWSSPKATAHLQLPAEPKELFFHFGMVAAQIPAGAPVVVAASVAGVELPAQKYTKDGDHQAVWPLSAADVAKIRSGSDAQGFVDVVFQVTPPFHPSNGDTRSLGVPAREFGFR